MNKKLTKLIRTLNNRTKELAIEILDSPIKWDLVNFYEANPFSIHTAGGLAGIIGRRTEQVFKEAEELTVAEVLKKLSGNGGSSSIYAYEPKPENCQVIRALVKLGKEDRRLIDELRRLIKSS